GARGHQAGEHEGCGCPGETRQGGTGASGAGSGRAELELHGDHRASRWRGDTQTSRTGTDRAGGTRIAGGCAARERVGDGELQRDATEEHEARAESGSEGGYIRENFQRAGGLDRRCDGIRAESAAAGKRHRKLREGSAANSRKDRAGPDSFGEGGPAAGDERGRDGSHKLTRNKDRDSDGYT